MASFTDRRLRPSDRARRCLLCPLLDSGSCDPGAGVLQYRARLHTDHGLYRYHRLGL